MIGAPVAAEVPPPIEGAVIEVAVAATTEAAVESIIKGVTITKRRNERTTTMTKTGAIVAIGAIARKTSAANAGMIARMKIHLPITKRNTHATANVAMIATHPTRSAAIAKNTPSFQNTTRGASEAGVAVVAVVDELIFGELLGSHVV